MQNITSFQVISAFIVALIGFAFRMGLYYESKKVLPNFWSAIFLFVFSVGFAALMFLWVIEKEWTATFKLIPIWISSFLGSAIIRGIGSIRADFFKEIFEDFLRKWLNSKQKTDDNTPSKDLE